MSWNHRRCKRHVDVAGVRVCVEDGSDLELARLGWVRRLDPLPALSSAEALRHAACRGHADGNRFGLGRLCWGRGQQPADAFRFAGEIFDARVRLEARMARLIADGLEQPMGGDGHATPYPWLDRALQPG